MRASLKQRIFRLVDDKNRAQLSSNRAFSIFIMILIVTSIIAIICESFENLSTNYYYVFEIFEVFVVAIFTLEYIFRIWTASLQYPTLSKGKAILKFAFSTMAIIDLLAILPFYLELSQGFFTGLGIAFIDLRFIRGLRLLRLLRIFKLRRYSKSMQTINEVLSDKKEELMVTIFVCFILLVLSSSIMYSIEHEAQEENFPNIIATFWWAIATLTTVGYGDVYPITPLGRFVGGFIALLGIGLVALPTGIVSSSFIEKIAERKEKNKGNKENEIEYCPHCGKKLPHE